MRKQLPNIALIAGGYSGEYEVSVRSAAVIIDNIDIGRYNVYLISVTRDQWACLYENTKIPVDKNDFTVMINGEKVVFDTAFIMIHGTPGEDGLLQGYFDMLNIPYTTCNAAVSAVTFNKYLCNSVIRSFGGVLVANSCRLTAGKTYEVSKIAETVKFPCFVKPNAGGSSLGTTKVHGVDNLQDAIDLAFREDDEVLVESFIAGVEITCGVLKSEGQVISLPLTMIKSKKEFFDFEAKYDPKLADEITPAPINESISEHIRLLSEKYYTMLGCSGLVRFDYILDGNDVWFLEVNTIPGMTKESLVPQQAEAYGWSYRELISKIIAESLQPK
jgi:D-alanine-D-alanine ligase